MSLLLPEHLRVAVVTASPKAFLALQVYSPESSGYTGDISRMTNPKSQKVRILDPALRALPFQYL